MCMCACYDEVFDSESKAIGDSKVKLRGIKLWPGVDTF